MTPDVEKWCRDHKVPLEDGLPIRATETGPPKPCFRCGMMVECPVDCFWRVNGQDHTGPICDDCMKLMQTDHRTFWDHFKTEDKL